MTVAAGPTVTVSEAVPDLPPAEAVIVAVPGLTPVATPDVDTVAMLALLVVQVTGRSVTVVPLMSLTVAVKVVVPPSMTEALDGETVTLPTGRSDTVTVAVPVLVSLVAVIVAVPGSRPVTTPDDETEATVGALDDQVTVRPVRVLPF